MTEITKLTARPLARGQIKSLRADGIVLSDMTNLTPQGVDELIDRILGMVYNETEMRFLDAQPNPVSLSLFGEIIELTYGKPGESKNLSAPGNGASKAARSAAGNAGKKAKKPATRKKAKAA